MFEENEFRRRFTVKLSSCPGRDIVRLSFVFCKYHKLNRSEKEEKEKEKRVRQGRSITLMNFGHFFLDQMNKKKKLDKMRKEQVVVVSFTCDSDTRTQEKDRFHLI